MSDKNNITRYQIGDLRLDIQRGELTRLGEAIALPKLSYDLLVALAHAAPALLSQAELMTIVWPDRVIGDETLKQRIKLLRKSLGDDASAPSYIEAVRGRGYRLIPDVTSECVIKQPPSIMLDLSANDRFPNISGALLGSTWQKVSTYGLVIFLGLVVSSRFIPSSISENITIVKEPSTARKNGQLADIALTENNDVNRYYARGRTYYHRYRKDDNEIAIDFFQKALRIDTGFAPAYAGLSQAYSQKYFQFSGVESDKQKAIDNAYQALSYDNQSAQAYKALGTAYYVSGWLSKSIKTLLRGKIIEPNNAEILINLAYIYSEQGELESALLLHKLVLELNSDHGVAMLHLGLTLQRAGYLQLAKMWYERALSFQPDYLLSYYYLAQLAIESGNFSLASSYHDKVNQLPHTERSEQIQRLIKAEITYYQGEIVQAQKYYQLYAQSASGQLSLRAKVMSELLNQVGEINNPKQGIAELVQDSLKQLKMLQQQGNEQSEISLLLAEIYSAKGELTLAKRYLTQALEQGYNLNYRVVKGSLFQALRATPYFEKLREMQPTKKAINLDDFFLLSNN